MCAPAGEVILPDISTYQPFPSDSGVTSVIRPIPGTDNLYGEYVGGAENPLTVYTGRPNTPAPTVETVSSPVIRYTPPPPPAPFLPSFTSLGSTNFAIKQAPIDTIIFDDNAVTPEMLSDLLYDDIAGLELANISRTDLIDGQQVIYSPIANLSDIYRLFNPNNIIASPGTLLNYLSSFAINLILRGMNVPEFDEDGNLIIEIDNVLAQEEIQAQISSSGTIEVVEI